MNSDISVWLNFPPATASSKYPLGGGKYHGTIFTSNMQLSCTSDIRKPSNTVIMNTNYANANPLPYNDDLYLTNTLFVLVTMNIPT